MISKAEPCLVVSIQNQLTLHRNCDCSANSGSTGTKTIIWRLCCTCIVNFVIIMDSLFKLFEILAWIIRSGGFDERASTFCTAVKGILSSIYRTLIL